jgi:HEAT repeat protein
VVQCLEDSDAGVRCQVAIALGEWGGEAAARALRQILQRDRDEDVQLSCITALRTIGGSMAAEGLRWAAERGTDAVREAALGAIEELATGGAVEDSEGPPLPSPAGPRRRGAVRTRGAVRVRGSARKPRGGDVVDSVVATLHRIRAEETTSDYLRQRAADVLDYLEE